jgi:hypothetical protein
LARARLGDGTGRRNGSRQWSALQISSVTKTGEGKLRGGIEMRPAMGGEVEVTTGRISGGWRSVARWLQPSAVALSQEEDDGRRDWAGEVYWLGRTGLLCWAKVAGKGNGDRWAASSCGLK